jgi:serpin B
MADFSKLGTANGNIYLYDVPHKTYLKVDEEGTIAVAITMPSFRAKSAAPESIVLDRAFLYAIIDDQTGLPIFLGIMNDPTK